MPATLRTEKKSASLNLEILLKSLIDHSNKRNLLSTTNWANDYHLVDLILMLAKDQSREKIYATRSNSSENKDFTNKSHEKTYQNLHMIVSSIHQKLWLLSLLCSILDEAWPETHWPNNEVGNLSIVDTQHFQKLLAEKKSLLQSDLNNDTKACYILLIKAAFSIRIFLERAKKDHPLPSLKPATIEEARKSFTSLKLQEFKAPLSLKEGIDADRKASNFFTEEARINCMR